MARIVAAQTEAPPSFKSSRATEVITTYFIHLSNRLGNPSRLVKVEFLGTTGLDRTEGTGARVNFPKNHPRSRTT